MTALGLVDGFAMPARAAVLLCRTRGLKRYALLPLLVNLMAYALVVLLAVYLIWNWDLIVPSWEWIPGVGKFLSRIVNWGVAVFKWLLVIPLLMAVCYSTFTAVGMILASPFNDILSERVERLIHGNCRDVPGSSARQLVRGCRSTLVSLRIVLRQLVIMTLALPLLLIPVIGIVPFFLLTAYFAGVGFLDIPMAANQLDHRQRRVLVAGHQWSILGLGIAIELLFLVPFAAIFVLPLGVIGATMLYCRVTR